MVSAEMDAIRALLAERVTSLTRENERLRITNHQLEEKITRLEQLIHPEILANLNQVTLPFEE